MKTIHTIVTWTLALSAITEGVLHDTFTLGETDEVNRVFGPSDWDQVDCEDVATCPGWPTNWEDYHDFIPYNGTSNMCRDCSQRKGGICQFHQQSPIDLDRNITARRECKDRHRMNFVKGNCRFGRMKFRILPHVLRAYQPDYCQVEPNIDYSMGFPDPWMLKFTDITVPSHHSIEGHQFSAEIFLSHVYSARKPNKLIGNVAVFLEAGTEDDHYDFLQLYIKRFRQERTRVARWCSSRSPSFSPSSSPESMDDDDDESDDVDDESMGRSLNDPEDGQELFIREIDYVVKPPHYTGVFHPYLWVRNVGTEYYFRYNGSMPEPPCFEGVHWRVLRKPIMVAPSQISDLEDLIASRMDPVTCEYENAGKPREGDPTKVDINRPLQTLRNSHKLVYCECVDWTSPKKADKAYCNGTFEERGVFDRTWPSPAPSIAPSNSPSISSNPSESLPPSSLPSEN